MSCAAAQAAPASGAPSALGAPQPTSTPASTRQSLFGGLAWPQHPPQQRQGLHSILQAARVVAYLVQHQQALRDSLEEQVPLAPQTHQQVSPAARARAESDLHFHPWACKTTLFQSLASWLPVTSRGLSKSRAHGPNPESDLQIENCM